MAALAAALLVVVALCGSAEARARHRAHSTDIAEELPLPPDPPSAPSTAPSPAPALPAPEGPAPACTKEQAGAKAERLVGLLQELIVRDPDRARLLLDAFQQAVQHFTQQGEDLAEECRSFDALIARAAG